MNESAPGEGHWAFPTKRRVVTGESWPQSRQLMIYETRRFGALFVPVCTTSPSILFRWTSFSKYISSSPTANRRLPSKEISAVVKEGINGFRAVVSCRKVTAIVFFSRYIPARSLFPALRLFRWWQSAFPRLDQMKISTGRP